MPRRTCCFSKTRRIRPVRCSIRIRCAGFRLYGEVGPLRMVLCEQTDGLATYEVSGLHTGASTGPQPERLIAVI